MVDLVNSTISTYIFSPTTAIGPNVSQGVCAQMRKEEGRRIVGECRVPACGEHRQLAFRPMRSHRALAADERCRSKRPFRKDGSPL